jgi:NADPH:quinone reductase-like Zn-dependent oxidoreductase
MKAIQVIHEENGSRLLWAETDEPVMGPDDVLVDIHATTLNRADLAQAAGNYPPPAGASPILGLDMAGTIAGMGANVTDWQVGDRVCSLLAGGGYAERTVVDHRMLFPVPAGWSWAEAASLSEVYLTAFVNIFMEADFQPGETVLVHGGASGVGTAAIQLVKAAEETRNFTNGAGVDVILDMVGAAYLQRNISLLKTRGRLVWISVLGGAVGEINIGQLMGKRARLIGSVLRARPLDEKLEIVRRFREQFWPQVESGAIRPVIDRSFPVQEAQAAHDYMRGYENIGKIVLAVR